MGNGKSTGRHGPAQCDTAKALNLRSTRHDRPRLPRARAGHAPFSILHSSVVCALLVATSFCAAGPINYADPPQGLFDDEWTMILLNGCKCGYAHTTLTRKGDTIGSVMLETFKIERAGFVLNATQLMTSEEMVDGLPLAFTSDMDMALQKVRQQGVVRDGKVTVCSKQFGNVITETFDYPEGAVMSWAMMRLQEEKGYAPGTAYEMAAYVPAIATNRAITIKVKIEGEETIEIDGKKRKAIRSIQEMALPNMPTGITSTVWIDPQDHRALKTTVPMMGMVMEMVACSRAEALADFQAPEAFMNTLVKVGRPIDHKAARRIRMRLSLEGDGPDMPPLPKTGMQTPSQAGARSVVLEVARQDHAALAKTRTSKKVDRKALAEFLEPNVYINSDDPAVRKMAAEAAGDAKKPYEIANRLRAHVSETIADKSLNIGFASASEVCRNKAGDCSEHAVLLAALARAKGIPSRVACGLVYVPSFRGTEHVFGFHMWTQVYIDGQWVDLDAAQNETDCNPTHIALVLDSLHASGLGDLAFAIFPVMARLKIEIVDSEPISST